jgi:hypothetical protein
MNREALRRIVTAILSAETRRGHGGDPWADAVSFDEAGIGIDSLDAVNAAAIRSSQSPIVFGTSGPGSASAR